MRTITLALMLGAGCTQDITDSLVADYEARLAGIRGATQAYVDAVDAASELDEVPPAQTTYMGAIEDELDELDRALEGFHDCEMMGDSEARVTLARSSATAIQGLVNGLPQRHLTHTDLAECRATADDLRTSMAGHMGDLEEHSDSWGSNTCMGHGGEHDLVD